MKMKELCNRTGLTERTIRFYIERGLLSPMSYESGGRVYIDFEEQDVKRLGDIAVLRKAGFSIAQLFSMEINPKTISREVESLSKELSEQRAQAENSGAALAQLTKEDCLSSAALARKLASYSSQKELPQMDAEPDFGRFDLMSPAEKAAAYKRFVANRDRSDRRRMITYISVGALLLVMLTIWITLALSGGLKRTESPPLRFSELIVENRSEDEYLSMDSSFRAAVENETGLVFVTAGINQMNGRLAIVYRLGDDELIVSTRIFNEGENILMESLPEQVDTVYISSKNGYTKLELVLEAAEPDTYCEVYVESYDLDPDELKAAISGGLIIYRPWADTLLYPIN